MREIKFRAWNKNECKMAEVIEVTFNIIFKTIKHTLVRYRYKLDNGKIEDESEYIDEAGCGNIVLMQYTGLKDKNEKEIYEGDIIEGGYLNPLNNELISKKYVVEYENAQFRGKLIGHSPYGDTSLYFIKGEIIGNIYNNKELLEMK